MSHPYLWHHADMIAYKIFLNITVNQSECRFRKQYITWHIEHDNYRNKITNICTNCSWHKVRDTYVHHLASTCCAYFVDIVWNKSFNVNSICRYKRVGIMKDQAASQRIVISAIKGDIFKIDAVCPRCSLTWCRMGNLHIRRYPNENHGDKYPAWTGTWNFAIYIGKCTSNISLYLVHVVVRHLILVVSDWIECLEYSVHQ